jgi:hypothetical protein
MLTLLAATPILVSLLVPLVPGIGLVPWPSRWSGIPSFAARVILWSVVTLIISSLILAAIGLPPVLSIIGAVLLAIFLWFKRRKTYTRKSYFLLMTFVLIYILIFTAFSVPFLLFHDGLPTGDSQKSIYWANYIIDNQELPNYSLSIDRLNRDPVDFYTPGLHSLTAAVMQATPIDSEISLPFFSVGFLSIVLAMCVSVVATAIGLVLIRKPARYLFVLFVPFLILTNSGFLRYLREPGYHFQNIVGELLIFGLLFLVMSLLRKWRALDIILFILTAVALFLTHQFSVFLAVFALSPAVALLILRYKKPIYSYFLKYRSARYVSLLAIVSVFAMSVSLGLHNKIPHIFTSSPHLLASLPDFSDYLRIMGAVWLLLGLGGLVLLFKGQFRQQRRLPQIAFLSAAFILLLLSQGPRFFVDIPPVRALLYSVVPLSVTGMYLISIVFKNVFLIKKPVTRTFIFLLVVAVLGFPVYASVDKAFNLSHKTRTNSSLLSDHLPVISYIKEFSSKPAGAVLIDDYNRRSSSWIILSDKPTFSRLSSNIRRAMDEASQSDIRYEMYLRHLDFEKIFSLGSCSEIKHLIEKHNIEYIAGIDKSSYSAFSHNPMLNEVTKGGDLTLFEKSYPAPSKFPLCKTSTLLPGVSSWLLRSSTLANDIGDPEDMYKHLPASLLATRLSEPKVVNNTTYRTTTAPFISISFNANDYVSALWDQDHSGQPDSSLQVLIKTRDLKPLDVKVSDTLTVTVLGNGTPVTIPASHVNLAADDLVTFTILNPSQRPIDIDLIALGLSQVP